MTNPADSSAHDSGAAFKAYVAEQLPLVEGALASWRDHLVPAEDSDIHGQLRYFLYEPLLTFTEGGGKRIRPILVLLGAQAVGGSAEQALSTALSLEVFQSAALIHDDIADGGQLRRDAPCVHVAHGTGIAINVGDLALTEAYNSVIRDEGLSPELRLAVLSELDAMMVRTLEGQALDVGWVRDDTWDLTPEDYLFMAAHKTAYYSAATPLAVGAMIAGASGSQVEGLRAFGYNAGLAFQIADDLLNLCGDPDEVGKDWRTDITEGKRTLVALTALSRLEGAEHDELRALLSAHTSSPDDLKRAVELMDGCGAIEESRSRAATLVQAAKQELEAISPALEPTPKAILTSMADWFVERKG